MELDLCSSSGIKALLSRHSFQMSKALGQNFLIDPSVPVKMCGLSGIDQSSGVVEIGPGVGALSAELAKRAKKVVCIELDLRLKPLLEETLGSFQNVQVIFSDALETDFRNLAEEHFGGLRLFACANLPYYITTKVILRLLEAEVFEGITVMIQKEAAERFCSKPGDKNYVAATVISKFFADCEILFDIPPSSFLPNPHVKSSVIKFTKRERPQISDKHLLFRTIEAAFANRRKTILNALSNGLAVGREELLGMLLSLKIDPGVRGERLAVSDFCRIANEINHSRGKKD